MQPIVLIVIGGGMIAGSFFIGQPLSRYLLIGGIALIAGGLIWSNQQSKGEQERAARSIVKCASCGTKFTWSKWSQNGGCANCGSNVYATD